MPMALPADDSYRGSLAGTATFCRLQPATDRSQHITSAKGFDNPIVARAKGAVMKARDDPIVGRHA